MNWHILTLFGGLLGKLNLNQIPRDPITFGAAASIVGGSILVVILLTYFKKWKWLWNEWLTTTDHKKIGTMYLIVAGLMLARGGVDAVMMRLQQATSVGASHGIMSSNMFQQVFSAHGTIMIFFVGMGFLFGIVNLVLPLQIGSRDVAFPFMNATSFWLFAAGMVLINVSLVIGSFSGAGWLAYPPLSELKFSPGVGVDYWIWSLEIAGVGSLLSGINFMTTIFKMRAPGMTFRRLPMFVWSVMGTMTLVIFAFPILTVTLTLLFLDRALGMHFFTAGGGGNAMMYVNLIWAWGHPEVYILVLPAFGIYSEVVATFSRKRLFGYTSMVWAIWAIVLLSFCVWLHHFFTMGAGADVNAVFGIATMLIAVPTGVKIFNWLFTMYRGRIHFASPMIWFMGFVFLFTMGGVAGVLMAVPPIDFQVHNSLFLVAHFHTMIVSGVLFGYFAGLTYWFPKYFGFKLNERLGKYAAWCWIIGFVLAFGPLYILGLMGATRRLDHYALSTGWQPLFIVAGIGVAIICLGGAFQVLQLIVSFFQRGTHKDLSGDPWNGRTLEWSTPSPVPFYNFALIPNVTDRDAFWAMKQAKKGKGEGNEPPYRPIHVMKNTPAGLFIAAFAFAVGFGAVWHSWLLVAAGLIGLALTMIIRLSNDSIERTVSVAEIKRVEASYVVEGESV
ncbi:MAG TPA: cbb3-type cytochrome c oxidase subunit I [Candidatus Saccharimonadales bacterium]|nr:cbb3-type cytochrome c oxidase subunit I [Candidatus Saccharimonadales bacterium]